MIIRPGRMRSYITIQQLTDSQDAQGGKSQTWTPFTSAWASIRPLRGTEYLSADQQQGRMSHEIRTRWIDGIKPEMQIVYGSRTFRIVAPPVNEDERNMLIILMCEEVI